MRTPIKKQAEVEYLSRSSSLNVDRYRKFFSSAKADQVSGPLRRLVEMFEKEFNLNDDEVMTVFSLGRGRLFQKLSKLSQSDAVNICNKMLEYASKNMRDDTDIGDWTERRLSDQKDMDNEEDFEKYAPSVKISYKTSWVRVSDQPINVQKLSEETIESLSRLISCWQRVSIRSSSNFPISEDHRHWLIQSCETLLSILRNGMVEKGLLGGVAKRAKWIQAACALAIVSVSTGVGEGVGGEVYKTMAEATSLKDAASLCEYNLDKLLKKMPDGSSSDLSDEENRSFDDLLKRLGGSEKI